ncbi:S8 family peptidase [Ponticaulis sp.]|uniref:S8 family peptidase n=1 Tax=Ponticaulis sp. TaxID=2020902 RepID=UPI000B710400|nr:S8 family peptidase [Ponticaulis sp.]MAI90190.1 hypothetical protein [Ponticaulis sp.]OUX99837.1 MAG: hypothetical protein CBB65_07095 [Hyphomonadaceae bacterium TMED5]|tara:strand:+ start:154113 stop:157493 length:3381 start_codon:yes stop_codon:yes gene_type:complete
MKSVLYSSAAIAQIMLVSAALAPAHAQEVSTTEITASDERLNPQWGNLDSFWGNLDSFWGNLDSFEGEASAQWGNLDSFWGNLDSFWGNLDSFWGNLDSFEAEAQWGNLDSFWGNLDSFWGNLDSFWGNLDSFDGVVETNWGNLDSFDGETTPEWGNLDSFWGNLDSFWGNLDSFEGDADAVALWGNLDSFWGNLDSFWGNLDSFYVAFSVPEGEDPETYYGLLDPSWGNLDSFWGNLDSFNGNLDTSWGNLDSFWGNLDSFWGNLDSFWGNLDSFWGNLDSFWGNLDSFWGNLDSFDANTQADYDQLLFDLGTLYNMSQEQYAPLVAFYTGQDFWSGFAQEIFERYGIDPSDPSSLEGLTAEERFRFYIDWRDGLMQFNGIDRVDHWMQTINWSPVLTQDHDYNTQAVIGLLDFGITDETLLTHDVIYNGGYETDSEDTHGSAVVSLLIAPHDGFGVMGIAPDASVAAYNPFDETGTAGWEDVETGVNELVDNGARIINMSLGVPGAILSEEWAGILGGVVADPEASGTVFIKAAGNDGAVQSEDVLWDSAESLENLIIVGAIGLDGEIAEWSNTPGDACAIIDGECNPLMYNFIVAPGEFLLVSDGDGGVTRHSGTSFAAPLVSGTAALIHGAWPWWKDHGEETVDVILQTATDLGEEGVDEVYGWGLLNVEAALSPLDWENLRFYFDRNGNGHVNSGKSADWIRRAYMRSDVVQLEDNGAYVVALEAVGDTFRDFRIPLSTQLYGQESVVRRLDNDRLFQRHLHQRFVDWATAGSSFGDVQSYESRLGLNGDWALAMHAAPYAPGTDVREGQLPFQTDLVLSAPESQTEFRIGHGDGAARLNASPVFGFYSDFNVETGGVNPLLGLASGGTYASTSFAINERLSITASVTETSDDHSYIDPITAQRVYEDNGITEFAASAANVSMSYAMTDTVRISMDYTQLQERDSLLGGQGSGVFSLEGGAVTDAVTFASDFALPANFSLALSATMGETRATGFADGPLRLSDEGVTSSAFAIGLRRDGLLSDTDIVRVTLAQPLRVESGSFEYSALEVIDRETGELGIVTQNWGIADTGRDFNVELSYGAPIMDGMAEVSAFTRVEVDERPSAGLTELEHALGARFAIRY